MDDPTTRLDMTVVVITYGEDGCSVDSDVDVVHTLGILELAKARLLDDDEDDDEGDDE